MATGKSTVGRMLAEALGYRWVDTDALIESRHGPITEIFRNNGEEAFRAMEKEVAAELAESSGLVISTGGRMMLDPENAALLGKSSRVFCLTAEPEEIMRRVATHDDCWDGGVRNRAPAHHVGPLLLPELLQAVLPLPEHKHR